MRRSFQLLLTASAVTAGLTAGADSNQMSWPDGTLEPTCAPCDGPAFMILSKREDGTFIRLMGMESISKAEGSWAIELAAKPGQGQASFCDERRPAASRCVYGQSGSFTVRPDGSNRWTIEFSGSFTLGRTMSQVEGRFRASRPAADPAKRTFCG